MNYTISDKRLFRLVDKLINNYFSSPLVLVKGTKSGNYLYFVPESELDVVLEKQSQTDNKMIYGMSSQLVPFERNEGGRLFINNGKLFNELSAFLGLDKNELSRLIFEYMRDKYDTYFDAVVLDFI